MQHLKFEPLTKEAFAPFGQVIETQGSDHFTINNGSTERYHALAEVQLEDTEDKAIISIFRAQRLSYPLQIEMLERHPRGSQAFMPMQPNSFLIVVAPAGAQPDHEQIRCFITDGRQGINYAKGVWHHPILTLVSGNDYLIVDRSGAGENCDEYYFEPTDIKIIDIADLER